MTSELNDKYDDEICSYDGIDEDQKRSEPVDLQESSNVKFFKHICRIGCKWGAEAVPR
jgi:hypothetical protein